MSISSSASCGSEFAASLNSADVLPNLSFERCPQCKNNFDFLKRVNSSKVPLILPCTHTVCEDCIRLMVISNRTLCPLCKKEFTASRSQIDSLSQLFQPHYTVIGYLVWAKNSPVRSELNWVSTGVTLRSRQMGGGDYEYDAEDKSEDVDDKEKVVLVFDKCTEHNDQYLNINCEECGDVFCCYCFLENHAGHTASYMYKLTDEEKRHLEVLRMEVEVILAQLLMSKKRAKELENFKPNDVDKDVRNYFATLHAKLHSAELNLRKELTSTDSQEADLNSVNNSLKSGIRRVKNVINHFQLLNNKELNVRALLEEAQEVKTLPCRLVSDECRPLGPPIEFNCGGVFDNIENHISVRISRSTEYNLSLIEDWGEAQEKYEMEQMRRQNVSSSPPPSVEASAPSRPSKRNPSAESQTKRVNEGKARVVVTHINNLRSFFVQRHSSLNILRELNNAIGKKSRRKERKDFRIGAIYGVAYEIKNSLHWRRGRLLDYEAKGDKILYKVFFLDYGNTQVVSKEKLKELDMYTVKRQPFAYECRLANPDGDVFDENAHLQLPSIIAHKELYACGLGPHNDRCRPQEVELFVAASNGGLVSVRDLLLEKPSAIAETQEYALRSEMKLFRNGKRFTVGQEEYVSVVYVEDPHYICVQSVTNIQVLQKMKEDMEAYYKDQRVLNCIPVANTDVVARYEDPTHGNWHRAVITSVDVAAKEVDVHFVDWGKNATVSWLNLRVLTEDFIKAECQGIVVALADIRKPSLEEPWNPDAINFLRQQVLANRACRMVVSEVEPLEVALFQTGPSVDLCLNSLLVAEGYAFSTGKISETTYWPNVTDPPVEDAHDLTFQIVKKSEEVIMEQDEDAHLKSGLRLQVSVVNYESPDLLHVTFAKSKDAEDTLQKELQIHYSAKGERTTKTSWQKREKCVVYDNARRNFFRGVVKRPLDKEKYLVTLYDVARELEVARKDIFVQDPYFGKTSGFVYKCKLSGIRPAGDAGTWSQLAIEMLEKIFTMHKTIYIKKVEMSSESKIFGVVMWYCLITPARALEPSQIKFISINQSLIESGVAFTASLSPLDNCKEEKRPDKKKGKQWCDMVEEEFNQEVKEQCSDEEVLPTYQEGWLKPLAIKQRKFGAVLVCVDNEGYFYIRDENINSCYEKLEENLTSKFSSMENSQEDTQWEQKDMCTISYEGKWYRGTVMSVESPDEVCVEMIDFGSAHTVPKEHLSPRLMFADVPPFVYRVRLYDVHSKQETWSADDVSNVLEIVTDNVNIVIKGDLNVDAPHAEIYLDNGLSLNDLIVQKCPHMTRRETRVILGKLNDDVISARVVQDHDTTQESDFDDHYTYDCLPKVLDERKKLCVVSVLKWDTAYNVVLSSNENLRTTNDFVALYDELQENGPKQPPLVQVEVLAPCVCLQPEKNVWSRALVYNTNSLSFGFVLAFFVDYGTVEMVPAAHLRQMQSEWFFFPVYMQIAAIDVELLLANQAENVLQTLNGFRGKNVFVEVVADDPLRVHLYTDNGILCYENFVASGVVQAL